MGRLVFAVGSALHIYDVFWFAGEEGVDVFDGDIKEALSGGFCGPADMRGDEAILRGQERIVGGRRLR